MVALSPRDDVTKNADTQTGQSTIDARGQQGCENKNSSIKQDVPYGPENKNHGKYTC